ncbi:MAG: ABC transporter permease [Chloroflexota bacterium]|nr:ABC transporter permease [Chloroflexota bacterium]
MTGLTRRRVLRESERERPRTASPRRRPERAVVLGLLVPLLVLLLGLLAWEVVVRLRDTPSWFIPKPTEVARELVESRALIWGHTWTTLQEMLLGLALAFVLGVLLAVAIASSRMVERAVYPALVASQAVPIIALAPILLIWFGYGMTPKVIVVVLTCFFPIVVSMVDGLRASDADALALLRSMGASRWQIMRIVRVPAALPALFSGTRIAAAWSVIGALVGEWVGASSGLGYLMTRSASQFQTPRLYAAVFVAAALGITLFALVALAERVALFFIIAGRRGG